MLENFFDLSNTPDTFTVSSANTLGMPIRGLGGNDFIIGSGNADLLLGNTGADNIYGLDGTDTLHGGRGADLLFGNKGADRLLGERGNDVIFGGRDNDALLGGEGDDFLAGDAGTDTLTGGDGSDAFVLDIRHSTGDRALADIITDFSADEDEGDVFALTDGANDALTEADVTLETVGTDTFIFLKATGAFLAQVQGASAEEITGTFSTVRSTLDDTEPGATTLSLIPGKATVQGKVGDEDFLNMYQFQVTETSIVDFSLTGLSADADLSLYQDLDDDGEVGEDEIISQSVRSGNADETIENVTLNPGKYFLSVEQFEGDTSYNLSVAGVAGTVARDLAGSQPNTARTLSPDGEAELHDYVGGTDAVDTYRLEVINSGYLDVFTSYQEAAVNLNLWSDRNGNNQLEVDEIVAQGTNEIQLDIIDPGTYYVNVTAPGAATPYEIAGIASIGSRVDIESYDPLFPGLPTNGTLSQNDDSDPNDPDNYADPYLLPELGAGLTVTVTQESKDFDAYLSVVDLITGDVVAENDDIDTAGGNYDAQVSFTTEQGGQYVVYASSVDAPGVGDYTLNATVTGTVTQTSVSSAGTGNDVQLGGRSGSSSGSIVANNFSSDSQQLPIPTVTVKVDGKERQLKLTYQPLAGGQIESNPIAAMNQGSFGNCFFLAALTATFGKIEKNLSDANSKQSTVLNNAITSNGNNYSIKLYKNQGEALSFQQVAFSVDNQVLTRSNNGLMSDGQIYGAKWQSEAKPTDASGQTSIWASLFEKAFAQRQGGYEIIDKGGYGGNALAWITGKGIEHIKLTSSNQGNQTVYPLDDVTAITSQTGFELTPRKYIQKDDIFRRIETALNEGRYVVTMTPGTNDQKSLYGGVLQEGHAYSVHNAYEANGQKMILMRNPWGKDNKIGKTATEDPSSEANDGFVAITFDAFLKNFKNLSLTKA